MTKVIKSLNGKAFFIIDYDKKTPSAFIAIEDNGRSIGGWEGHLLLDHQRRTMENDEHQVILAKFEGVSNIVVCG